MPDEDCWAGDLLLAGNWTYEVGPHVVLGVDGGASNTVCVVMEVQYGQTKGQDRSDQGSQKVLGRRVAASSNHNSVGDKAARAALEKAMAGALAAANVPRVAVRGLCLGMAGVDRPPDVQKVEAWLREIFAHEPHISVHNDAVAALASGTGGQLAGCVLIAGTGTTAVGVASNGATCRASGGGPTLGDRGSGYAIAAEALAAVMRAHDGRGPHTALTSVICATLNLPSPDDLIGWAYAEAGWARVAALLPCVRLCARDGDSEAQRILREAAAELAGSIEAVVRRLQLAGPSGSDPFPLVLVGGVLEDQSVWDVSADVIANVHKALPAAQPIRPLVEPAVGAALLAWLDYNSKRS
eukprot:jgi/Mesen1/8741/ME000052S08173